MRQPRRCSEARRREKRRLLVEGLEERRLLAFAAATDYPEGGNPYAIVSADFNNDGNLDLATTIGVASNSRVSVRLGNGIGGFGSAREFATPGYDTPSSIFIADLNNDIKPDMVVSEFNSFSTLIGNGDGTFKPAVSTYGVSMAALGHFDNVGYIDGVATWIDGDWATHVQVYRGDGQGGFSPGPDASYWGRGGFAAGDLNNDGKDDVATGEGLVFRNVNYVLQFESGQQASLNGGAVAMDDFTGDGNVDVIVAGDGIALLRGRGDGSLEPPIRHSVNGSHTSVVTADFNGDGKLDAVVNDRDAPTASVILGNGDGTFRFGGAFASGTSPSGITVGDFNGDGRPDLAVANAGSRNVSVLLNDANWTLLPVSLSINDVAVTEGNTGTQLANFSVTLSAPTGQSITVQYATAAGTATAGRDYQTTVGSITFNPGDPLTKTISIAVYGDLTDEWDETFYVNLISANAQIVDSQGQGTILDNDPVPTLTIQDRSLSEGQSGTQVMIFTVLLSASSEKLVSVFYSSANGSALTADRDYRATSGNLSFAPGETSKTISVSIIGDKRKESDETFYLNLSNAIHAFIADSQAVGRILNDDGIAGKAKSGKSTSVAAAVDAAFFDLMSENITKKRR